MNRKIAPPIKDAIDFNLSLKPYEHYKLDNGISVYAINAGAQEVVQLEWVFFAGNSFEQKKGVAATTNFLLKNGTNARNAFQLNEAFEYYGAFCNRSCFNETAVLSLHTLSKHVDKLLPVIEEMLTDSVFPSSELEIYQQNSKQRLAVNLKKAEFVGSRLIDSYLYGDKHPYGVYTNPADLDNISAKDCIQFYNDYYLNGKCIIFVSGSLPSNLKQQLNERFGKLKANKYDLATPEIIATPAVEKKYRIQNDANAVQGAIRMGSPFPNRQHPDFKKVAVLNTLFGGFFGARLMSNIREDKGYTYGIYSYLQNHKQQSAWIISTEAGKDVCEATIEEVYKEMKILREEKVSDDELLLVRNYMIGSILGDLDGPFHIMARWKNIILNELSESYFNDSINEIKTISPDTLIELANKYFVPENFYELVVY